MKFKNLFLIGLVMIFLLVSFACKSEKSRVEGEPLPWIEEEIKEIWRGQVFGEVSVYTTNYERSGFIQVENPKYWFNQFTITVQVSDVGLGEEGYFKKGEEVYFYKIYVSEKLFGPGISSSQGLSIGVFIPKNVAKRGIESGKWTLINPPSK
jgi:hypothetical protein